MIWLLITFLPWYISRTWIPLNIGNDCDPLQIRPGWLFPDPSNEPVTWALLSLQLGSGMSFLFLYGITVLAYVQAAAENSFVSITFVLSFSSFVLSFEKRSILDGRYRPFSHCIDQAGLGTFTVKSGRKHYNPPPLTVMWMNFDSLNFPSFCSLSAIILFQTCSNKCIFICTFIS